MKIRMKKSITVKKGAGADKLEYFKKQIIAHLKTLKEDTPDTSVRKAVYGIGTIRTWNGKKVHKGR